MTDFKASLSDAAPAPELNAPLAALWWAAKAIGPGAQDRSGRERQGFSVGPCLSASVEGDLGNAGYWYRQAGKPVATGPVETEWERMVSALLGVEQHDCDER